MVVFLGIRPGQVPEEPQPEGLDPFRDYDLSGAPFTSDFVYTIPYVYTSHFPCIQCIV